MNKQRGGGTQRTNETKIIRRKQKRKDENEKEQKEKTKKQK